ncbi:hypothetical protein AB0N38_10680 [Micromonospora aurantiaca]|uniref:DUF6292 family protein n=1 Tax=Micromonospora aurantiaca (nom. illeg.) TaxID=47850 RepID=UPI003415F3AA
MVSRDERPPLRVLPSAEPTGGQVVPLPLRGQIVDDDVDARREQVLADYARSIGVDPTDGRAVYEAARARLPALSRMRAVAAGVAVARRLDLAAMAAAALAGLGGTAHEVARSLGDAGLRGWPGDPDMDPLCRWMAREVPGVGVWLGAGFVRVWQQRDGLRQIADVPLPDPVAEYAAAAAGGAYPWLRLSWAPPTVPVPHVDLGGGPEPPWWPDVGRDVDRADPVNPTSPAGGEQHHAEDVTEAAAVDPTPLAGQRPSAVAAPARPAQGVPAARPAPPTRQVPAGGGDTGRDLAHEPYVDAVAYSLQMRGVEAAAYWPGPSGSCDERDGGRQATLVLPADAWEPVWPWHSQVLLAWSEARGWRLTPMRGWDVDTDAVIAWWDGLDRPVLPDPDRLAAWVAAVLADGPAAGAHLPGAGIAVGALPTWRAPTTREPAFEAALDAYRRHIGHTLAREDRSACTVIIPAATGGGSLSAASAARARQVLREAAELT